jgi:prepilin-type N-terminal cleavage/methylation domain-containing protein
MLRLNQAGVTLTELMVVMVVLAIGILPIAAVQTRSNRDVFDTGQHTRALNLAQMQMEQAKSLGFDSAVSDSGLVGIYAWRTDITNVGQGLNQVRVRVSWTNQGDAQMLEINNLLSTR